METWLNRPRATAADRKFPATPFFISLVHSQSKLRTVTQFQLKFPARPLKIQVRILLGYCLSNSASPKASSTLFAALAGMPCQGLCAALPMSRKIQHSPPRPTQLYRSAFRALCCTWTPRQACWELQGAWGPCRPKISEGRIWIYPCYLVSEQARHGLVWHEFFVTSTLFGPKRFPVSGAWACRQHARAAPHPCCA